MSGWDVPERHAAFAEQVRASQLTDPMATLRNLSAATGVPVDALVHHALARWAAAGAEALLTLPSLALDELIAAREREDWAKVAGIVDWLAAGR